MTITDAGPIVALFDVDDAHHERCVAALPKLSRPLVTTWPCFTEAMYLLRREVGISAQEELWQWVDDGLLFLADLSEAERGRARRVMTDYRDRPCDLADATLVAIAETVNVTRIFSIDSDFYVYRMTDGHHFEVIPGPVR